jgi:hypothetical protein
MAVSASGNRPGRPPAAPLCCQVPLCGMTLRTAALSSYHTRNRLCAAHMRAEVLHLPDGARRFCQARCTYGTGRAG